MFSSFLPLTLLVGAVPLVLAQGFVPLNDKRFTYPDGVPYKVDTDIGLVRGDQLGYNICNSTTEGPTSLCQTAFINSLDDFCLWAPPTAGKDIGSIEGEMVAWCTRPGHGTRIIPDGTITGVQFTRAPDYIQVVGFMDQTKINILEGDAGGEMDPHGADLRGNPMGGIMFSESFNGSWLQVIEWHNFMGANMFCLKACDPRGSNDRRLCEHIYDTQGCGFNAPSGATNGVFESCASDNQNPPGQGPAVPPASSLCSTFASTAIFGAAATETVPIPQITGLPAGVTTTPGTVSRTRTSSSRTTAPPSSSRATNTPASTMRDTLPVTATSGGSATRLSTGLLLLFPFLLTFLF